MENQLLQGVFPANIYLFKINNKNIRKRCKIYSKLTIKTPERSNIDQLYQNTLTPPTGNYMFKVNNRNTRTRCKIYSRLTIKTPERR